MMEENENKKVEISEESEKRIAKAVSKEMRKFSFKSLGVKDILTLIVLVVVLIAGICAYSKFKNIESDLSSLVTFDNGADSHDLVLDNKGILGYTAADFEEAILGDSTQLKKIEVYKQEISEATTLTNTGLLNLSVFTKTQVITYKGTVTYVVDMTNINSNNIVFNEEEKTITLKIPHAEQNDININENDISYADPERGLLAFGEIKASVEKTNELQAEIRTKMEDKLETENVQETADRFAKLTIWEIYSPIIKSVAKDYSLVVEFID